MVVQDKPTKWQVERVVSLKSIYPDPDGAWRDDDNDRDRDQAIANQLRWEWRVPLTSFGH